MSSRNGAAGAAIATGVAVLLVLSAVASAQDAVIVGGEVHTLAGPPQIADVVIADGRIVSVGEGAAASAGLGDEAVRIDATGMIVTPGLVDTVTSVGLVEIWAVESTRDVDGGGDGIRAGFRAVDALNPESTLLGVARRDGVTSVVSHPSGGLVAGQSVWWDLGRPRLNEMVAAAPATMDLRLDAGAAAATGGSRGSAMLRYRELFADVAAWQADPTGYDRGQMRNLSLSLVDLEALAPVLQGETPVLVSAHRQADILAALALADEYGLDIAISGGAEAWAVTDDLAAAGVPVVVNPLRNAPYSFEQMGSRADTAALLDEAGVPVILSTFETHRVSILRQVAGNAVREGMDHRSALAAVTRRPAEALGLEADYGTLEPGKVANVVVWSGDPFELSTRARHVLVRGEAMPLENRQTELFQRYRALPTEEESP